MNLRYDEFELFLNRLFYEKPRQTAEDRATLNFIIDVERLAVQRAAATLHLQAGPKPSVITLP